MQSALVRIAAGAKYGATAGDQVWQQFRAQNDPEALLTLHNGQGVSGASAIATRSAPSPTARTESPSGGQTGPRSTLPTSASESQSHKGSAFQYGWWGWVDKDLRATLGDAVPGWPQKYCGGGTVGSCRGALLTSLTAALAEPAATTYPADTHCAAGDQWCADAIVQSPLGGIKHRLIAWQNRPTYQQVVSFPAGRGDDVSNPAAGRSATASSVQSGNPAANAMDGNATTRWASSWADNQWLRVDLGSVRPVARAVLRWEAAYASAYRIETSTDGTSWTTAAIVTGGNGGLDTVAFPWPTPATCGCSARPGPPPTVSRSTSWRCTATSYPAVMPWETSVFDEVATVREVTVVVPAPDKDPVRVPIWVVAVDGELYARSWKGEGGVWYRRARRTGIGSLVSRLGEHRVRFVPVDDADLEAAVDRAYLTKYAEARYARAMVEPPATGTTMRLVNVEP